MISQQALPFEVEPTDLIFMRTAGKVEGTVLTIERKAYSWIVCEYVDQWSYMRFWCFKEFADALTGLLAYLELEEAKEPGGWERAIDYVGGARRIRRVFYAFGKRQVVESED